jgi:hypothetical protein
MAIDRNRLLERQTGELRVGDVVDVSRADGTREGEWMGWGIVASTTDGLTIRIPWDDDSVVKLAP